MAKKISCTSCGGEITLHYAFSKSAVCPYCGLSTYITPDGAVAQESNKVVLVDYGSPFSLGTSGKLTRKVKNETKKENFLIIGRLRFEYEDGFWDEWMLLLNDQPDQVYWLQETEGRFNLMVSKPIPLSIAPAFEKAKVGTVFTYEKKKIFIRAKSWAKVVGAEGESAFELSVGSKADFIDGICEGKEVAFEYLNDEITFNTGETIEVSSFVIGSR